MSVYFIDCRNVIADGGQDVINRHNIYATKFKTMSGESESKVIVASRKPPYITKSDNLILKGYSRSYLKYIANLFLDIHSNPKDSATLVAGDPWLSGITAIAIQYLLRIRGISSYVQIQVHADICDTKWINQSLKNRIKSELAIKVLSYSNSIRYVSMHQKILVHKRREFLGKQEIVVPVFLEISIADIEKRSAHPRVIGFVGRMEKERGTNSLIELIAKLSVNSNQSFQVKLIGTGKELNKTRFELERIIGAENLEALGHLSKHELAHEWSKIGLLINLAPSESYGRTMREAAMHGVPIWSLHSNGFAELKEKFPLKWIRELQLCKSYEELQTELNELFSSEPSEIVRNTLLKEQGEYLDELVKSWIFDVAE